MELDFDEKLILLSAIDIILNGMMEHLIVEDMATDRGSRDEYEDYITKTLVAIKRRLE